MVLDRNTGQIVSNGNNTAHPIASVVKLFIADDLLLQESKGQTQLSPADRAVVRRHAAVVRRQRRRGVLEPQRRQRDHLAGHRAVRVGMRRTTPYNGRWFNTLSTTADLVRYYDKLLAGSGGLPPERASIIVVQPGGVDADGDRRHACPAAYTRSGSASPRGSTREPVAVKQGWMCCWNGGNWMHMSTGVIGPDRRYVMAIGSDAGRRRRHRPRHHHAGSQDDVPRRPDLVQQVAAEQIGAAVRVRCSPCSRRHAAILAWSPDSSTSGTSSPRQLGGRV